MPLDSNTDILGVCDFLKMSTYQFFLDPATWILSHCPELNHACSIWKHNPKVYTAYFRLPEGTFVFARHHTTLSFDTWEAKPDATTRLTLYSTRPLDLEVPVKLLAGKFHRRIWCGQSLMIRMSYMWEFGDRNAKQPA